jgi:Ala-tRNA(Pro) deacylase
MFLITAANDTKIDMKKLPALLDCQRLSFGSPDRLWTYLGIRPGSVNPFCIVNDKGKEVTLILDQTMMQAEILCVHPFDNAKTIGISPTDLTRYIEDAGHVWQVMDLAPAAPDA